MVNGTQRTSALTRLRIDLKKQFSYHLMILPAITLLIVFAYLPMVGLQIAFKDFMFNKGIWGSPWVGLKFFMEFVTDPSIPTIVYNTLMMSLIKVVFMFPVPIVFALMLNEIGSKWFKRAAQTISYFPNFISWVIVAFMATNWFSPSTGFVNALLMKTGIISQPFLFLGEPKAFWWLALVLEIWKSTGWGSIIYLAAIAGIDQEMYEAAVIDGASRLQRMGYITLPCIKGTIMIMLILNIGNMLYGGLYASNFQVSYLLGNALNKPTSQIIDTYVLSVGISLGRYSYATAVGLLSSVVSMVLLLGANFLSAKFTGESFF